MWRTWYQGLLGAAGAAAVVPVGLVLAIGLAATVSGDGLRDLGQIADGPSLPGETPVAAALAPAGRQGPGGVPAVPIVSETTRRSPSSVSPGSGRPGRGDSGERRERDTSRATTPSNGQAQRPRPTPTAPAPTAPEPTPTPPAPQPDLVTEAVRDVGDAATEAVRPLPVVGQPAADAVETVIDLVAPPQVPAAPVIPGGGG